MAWAGIVADAFVTIRDSITTQLCQFSGSVQKQFHELDIICPADSSSFVV
jgi:hypothetical protein